LVVTEVFFHFNAADKRGYACRLLRKAYLQGARVLVLAEQPEVDALDAALWALGGRDFIPHARVTDGAALQAYSPILIGHEWPTSIPRAQEAVLLNLSHGFPAGFEQFARVIEVVSQDTPDRERARERWKHYRSAGAEPVHHDVVAS
jgi:DNA polymerase-3 subunit chi